MSVRDDVLGAQSGPASRPAGAGSRPAPASSCSSASANPAGPDETAALPSVARLARYTGLSERAVRTCLDLDSGLVRDDLDDAAAAVLD